MSPAAQAVASICYRSGRSGRQAEYQQASRGSVPPQTDVRIHRLWSAIGLRSCI